MRSYCRRVCGCMPASSAATAIANTGASSSSIIAITVLSFCSGSVCVWSRLRLAQRLGGESRSTPRGGRARPPAGTGRRSGPRLRHHLRTRVLLRLRLLEFLQCFARGIIQMRGHRDLELGEQVTGPLRGLHTTALDAQHAPGRGARCDAELDHVAAEGRNLDRRAQRRLCEGHRHGQTEVEAVTTEDRMRSHRDLHNDVTVLPAVGRRTSAPAQTDLLPVCDTGRDLHLERLAVLALQGDRLSLHSGDEVERRARRDVSTLLRTAEATVSAAGLSEASRAERTALAALVEHRED